MSDAAWMGVKLFFTGLFGNIGVLIYAWFAIPGIFNRELSTTMRNTMFVVYIWWQDWELFLL